MITGLNTLYFCNDLVSESRNMLFKNLLLKVRHWLAVQEELVGLED